MEFVSSMVSHEIIGQLTVFMLLEEITNLPKFIWNQEINPLKIILILSMHLNSKFQSPHGLGQNVLNNLLPYFENVAYIIAITMRLLLV